MSHAPVEGQDYYYDEQGRLVMTEAEHLRRGKCCGNHCKHCPYGHSAVRPQPKPKGKLYVRRALESDADSIAHIGRLVHADRLRDDFEHPEQEMVPYLNHTFAPDRIRTALQATKMAYWVLVDAADQAWGYVLKTGENFEVVADMCVRRQVYTRANERKLLAGSEA